MSAFRPRLRALAALVALCLSVGPAASALCPHADAEGHGEAASHAAMPSDVPPCHEPPPEPEPQDAECASPCCEAAAAPAPAPALALAPTALLPARIAVPTATPAALDRETRLPPRPPPDDGSPETVRLRV